MVSGNVPQAIRNTSQLLAGAVPLAGRWRRAGSDTLAAVILALQRSRDFPGAIERNIGPPDGSSLRALPALVPGPVRVSRATSTKRVNKGAIQ